MSAMGLLTSTTAEVAEAGYKGAALPLPHGGSWAATVAVTCRFQLWRCSPAGNGRLLFG